MITNGDAALPNYPVPMQSRFIEHTSQSNLDPQSKWAEAGRGATARESENSRAPGPQTQVVRAGAYRA